MYKKERKTTIQGHRVTVVNTIDDEGLEVYSIISNISNNLEIARATSEEFPEKSSEALRRKAMARAGATLLT